MNENQEFKHFIRIIGRGQRAGRTLTQQEAYDAMTMVIEERVTPEQKGAFLMLLRVREETSEELAGFTQAFRQHSLAGLDSLHIDLDMGCYAGKRRQLPWFLLAVLVLAQHGKRIFLHGTTEPDSKRLYLNEVLPHLGFDVATSTQMVAEQLATHGFSYMGLEQVNPQLDKIIQLRDQFGLRSCANTLARILNPSNADYSLQGVFHRQVDEKHRLTCALLDDPNMLCFRGEGGEIEFNPERDVALHICRNGESKVINVAAFNETRVTKPRQLIANELIEFWEGKENSYAQDAVMGTLSVMLVLLDDLEWSEALNQAKALWSMRNKSWPGHVQHKTVTKPLFDTTGKHYAH
ncbi:glycosyl transferase family protein [Aliiglaciecola aliphaticivorans]